MSSLPGYWALRSEPPRHIPPRTSPALPLGARCVLLGYGAPMGACSSQALGQLFGSAHSGSSVHKMPVPGPPSQTSQARHLQEDPMADWDTEEDEADYVQGRDSYIHEPLPGPLDFEE